MTRLTFSSSVWSFYSRRHYIDYISFYKMRWNILEHSVPDKESWRIRRMITQCLILCLLLTEDRSHHHSALQLCDPESWIMNVTSHKIDVFSRFVTAIRLLEKLAWVKKSSLFGPPSMAKKKVFIHWLGFSGLRSIKSKHILRSHRHL